MCGLPDSEDQWSVSKQRKHPDGIARQGTWRRYSSAVRLNTVRYSADHPAANAILVVPQEVRAWPQYEVRRAQFKLLRDCGVDIRLGANRRTFFDACEDTLGRAGTLVVMTHVVEQGYMEFADGFLSFDEIGRWQRGAWSGVFDAAGCRQGKLAKSLKAALGGRTWVIGARENVSVSMLLASRVLATKEVVQRGGAIWWQAVERAEAEVERMLGVKPVNNKDTESSAN